MSLPDPPIAERRPHSSTHHGVTIEDPWAWLRDPAYPEVKDEEVLAYLRAENAYFEAAMAPHQGLIDTIFAEMRGRIPEDDSSVPVRDGDWLYWWAFQPGAQYRTWYRRPVDGGAEQVIFDEPAEADGKQSFQLGAIAVSPDARLLAVMVDDDGSERYRLDIRDIAAGKVVETVTEVGIGAPVWTADSRGIVFTEVNEHWRSYRARLHWLGQGAESDRTLYEESENIAFSVSVSRTQDRRFILIGTGENSSNEIRFVPADAPEAAPVLIAARRPEIQYDVDSGAGRFWIVANDDHVNFRLAEADPVSATATERAKEVGSPGSISVASMTSRSVTAAHASQTGTSRAKIQGQRSGCPASARANQFWVATSAEMRTAPARAVRSSTGIPTSPPSSTASGTASKAGSR